MYYCYYSTLTRCFSHIVNLACQAVIGALTDTRFMDETHEDYDPGESYYRDIIATIRSLTSAVCCLASFYLIYD